MITSIANIATTLKLKRFERGKLKRGTEKNTIGLETIGCRGILTFQVLLNATMLKEKSNRERKMNHYIKDLKNIYLVINGLFSFIVSLFTGKKNKAQIRNLLGNYTLPITVAKEAQEA